MSDHGATPGPPPGEGQPPPPAWPSRPASPGAGPDASPQPPPPQWPDRSTSQVDAPAPPPWPGPEQVDAPAPPPWPAPEQVAPTGSAPPPASAPPPPSSTGRGARIAAFVVLLVVALVGLGLAMAATRDTDATGPGAVATEAVDAPEDADDATAIDESSPPVIDQADADVLVDLLEHIDRAELAMIDLALGTSAEDTELEALVVFTLDRLVEEHDALTEIVEMAGDGSATDVIGSAYLRHLEDWLAWTEALAEDPGVLGDPEAEAAHVDAIGRSAEEFVAAVDATVPDRDVLPVEARDLLDLILDRGFTSEQEEPGDI